MNTATKKNDGVWCTRFGSPDLQYRMLGRPNSDGWADFQCLSDLQRVREWNLSDMVPLNDAARSVLPKAES